MSVFDPKRTSTQQLVFGARPCLCPGKSIPRNWHAIGCRDARAGLTWEVGRRFLSRAGFHAGAPDRSMELYPFSSANEEARRLNRPWLGAILAALDVRLRLHQGVIEYTRCPTCLFRIQVITSCDDFVLSRGPRGPGRHKSHLWQCAFCPGAERSIGALRWPIWL